METEWYWKIYHILKVKWVCCNGVDLLAQAPFYLLLVATVPVVDYDEEDEKWRRYLAILNCLVSPVFFVFGAGSKYPSGCWVH